MGGERGDAGPWQGQSWAQSGMQGWIWLWGALICLGVPPSVDLFTHFHPSLSPPLCSLLTTQLLSTTTTRYSLLATTHLL